jgi:hypothetical protein
MEPFCFYVKPAAVEFKILSLLLSVICHLSSVLCPLPLPTSHRGVGVGPYGFRLVEHRAYSSERPEAAFPLPNSFSCPPFFPTSHACRGIVPPLWDDDGSDFPLPIPAFRHHSGISLKSSKPYLFPVVLRVPGRVFFLSWLANQADRSC